MESVSKTSYCLLSSVPEGTKVKIEKIDSGLNLKGRLAELGIYPGEIVKVVRNTKRGPVLVSVKDTTFMLGRSMTNKIFVR